MPPTTNHPPRSRAQDTVVTLFRTAGRLRRLFASLVEPYGITLQQFNVLRILRGAGKGGLPTMAIAERMVEADPGVTRLLDRLERKGLVARERAETDRRQVVCVITASGLALLRDLDHRVKALDASVVRSLSAEQQDTLVGLLNRLTLDPP